MTVSLFPSRLVSPLLAGVMAALLGAAPASAQVSPPSGSVVPDAPARIAPQVQAAPPAVRKQARRAFRGDDLSGKDGPMSKIGRVLATLYYQHQAKGPTGVQRLLGKQTHQGLRAQYYAPISADGRFVTVNAIAAEGRHGLWADLRGLGLRAGAATGSVVSGRLPISSLKDAAQLPSLRGMMLAYAQTHVGSVGSEADTSHRAYQGRTDLNVDGSGEKVCVLSDSYDTANTSTSASDDIQSGDLPGSGNPDGRTTPVDVLEDYDGSTPSPTDEGRAMLQLIHDIAPGAELGFHTAFGGLAGFVNGIRDLADPAKGDCTLLVDDIRYNIEPFYQDGPVTNVVDSVVNEGIPYFSSAGNDGQNSYEAPYRNSGNSGVISSSSVSHDFDPSDSRVDTLQKITIQEGGTFRIFTLQWTDPSAVVEGSAPADTDIDVAIVNDTLGIVSQSARNSDLDGNGIPFEGVLEHTNNGNIDANQDGVADSTFHVVIEKAAGPDPDEVKYIYSGSDFDVKEYDTLGPTIYGHPMAENAMAVGAAPFFNTEAFNDNADPAVLESFSSKGGIPILFDQTGTPYPTPQTRQKPDVTGTDAIDNTFFGSDIGLNDSDPHPNFFGTSAAAPNVAAIAALIQEANPGFSPTDVYNQLESNAEDVTLRQKRDGNFESVASGVDPWSGHGFVKATAAALPVELARFDATLQGRTVILTWTTASETNNAGFGIEHKRAGGTFETIAYKDGGGTTSESRTYRYQTEALRPGSHTFRLRQEDLDGSTTYSAELTVERTLSGRYSVSSVSPNPVSNAGTATVTVRAAQDVRVGVYNVLGQRVALLHDGPMGANDPTTLTMGPDLQSGVYFLRVDGETFSATRKFVRVR
ncbi:MAG: T9SS type A sorting domain-containing protein [Salinibacter sp.]